MKHQYIGSILNDERAHEIRAKVYVTVSDITLVVGIQISPNLLVPKDPSVWIRNLETNSGQLFEHVYTYYEASIPPKLVVYLAPGARNEQKRARDYLI